MKFKKLISIGVMTLSLILPSCSCDAKNDSESTQTPSTKEYSVVTKTIGTNGGQVKDEESYLGLNIPAGALKGDTNITAQYVGEPAKFSSAPILGFLCGAEFGPSGTVFEKPVQVTLKLDKAPINDQLSVAYYDEENKLWECAAEATYSNNQVTFEVTHFSKYQVLDLPISVFNQYVYTVREAIRTNKSDSWITQTYLEYLLDDIHVMDYYGEYNGYVYYPVGFQINGQYAIDGKESDNNETTYRYGELNHAEFSSTTDYCLYGSMFSSYQEFKRQREQAAQENQEIIDILLVVYYKMCKPIIDLTAPDTKLKKGESTTVTLHCHYRDSDNYFPNLRDIDLPYYKLTISDGLSHLKVDKKELTTNENGVDTFRVTSKDGKEETITVIFDVAGEYGQHAEGTIFFGEDKPGKYSFSGSIKQEVTGDYCWSETSRTRGDGNGGTITDTIDKGMLTVTIEYPIEGTITFDGERTCEGDFKMGPVQVKLNVTKAKWDYVLDHPFDSNKYMYYEHNVTTVSLFESQNITINEVPEIDFYGMKYTDQEIGEHQWVFNYGYKVLDFDIRGTFIKIEGTGYYDYVSDSHIYTDRVPGREPYEDTSHNENHEDFSLLYTFGYPSPLANIEDREGTQVLNLDNLIMEDWLRDDSDRNVIPDCEKRTTTQTITLTRVN